ncbi:cytochrome oxidase putative small subunit CydP [Glaciimonas sp. PAMC28666]|uniref:cytochrome oxidase putative small subunit CydP n=1 Tax=Glaciimonas sp. PAMC28666 TaxID=2807626 RepID=UPI0019642590|nr:cytochrome oxidase putative small subunit CydP [Glaciimonas sp. PAMC28666]QRX82782.1 hypothetical protein JQN73_00200 [Glaciimonas sp. PAMC28666]
MHSFIFPKSWSRLPLWVEISLIVVVKLALLFILWKLFFSAPQTKKMRMPTDLVEQHFLTDRPLPKLTSTTKPITPTSLSASTTLPPSSPTSEAQHDSH